jgi:hypothetical protein
MSLALQHPYGKNGGLKHPLIVTFPWDALQKSAMHAENSPQNFVRTLIKPADTATMNIQDQPGLFDLRVLPGLALLQSVRQCIQCHCESLFDGIEWHQHNIH